MGAFSDTEFDLEPERVKELFESGEAQLVDVRQPEEYEAGHVERARHIELGELGAREAEIAKGEPVIFYCRVGSRSELATQAFRATGYDAYSMTGGITAWFEAGLPLEPKDGRVAEH